MDTLVGVLGGGQLGRMLIADASRLGVQVCVLDPDTDAPAKQVSAHPAHRTGSFADAQTVLAFAQTVDVLTVEIEHVNVDALAEVERQLATSGGRSGRGVSVRPSASVIRTIQNKHVQHMHLRQHGIPVAPFGQLDPDRLVDSAREQIRTYGLPLMIKSSTLAYDGRGNYRLEDEGDLSNAINALGNGSRPLYVEQVIHFAYEVAVMVVRSRTGQMVSYPAVETIHRDNICHLVFAPLRSGSAAVAREARQLAERAVQSLGDGAVGVFGVEMFVTADGSLLVNEIAPRPHNSGHYTIEACSASQYENHLRAIVDLPLGSPALRVPCAAMLNILGASDDLADLAPLRAAALSTPDASYHWYGKAGSRRGRKLGHVTLTAESASVLDSRLAGLLAALPPLWRDREEALPLSAGRFRVGVIMGSDSDLRVMRKAAEILTTFDVPFELNIVSAHRTPHLMVQYATAARDRGIEVIIAGAGGAAHLPGMVAALTTLPVIGVPVKASTLDGVDSLYSIVQMPRGVPVASVAIDNATNAALLAIRILSTQDRRLADRLAEYAAQMEGEVQSKRDRMSREGWSAYVAS